MVKENLVIPAWLCHRISHADLATIATAVRQVEVTTNGEIVPMVVRRSTVFGHVFPLLTLAFYFFYFALGGGELLSPWRGGNYLWLALDLGLLTLLAWRLSRWTFVQRLLTTPGDLEAQVYRRAELEFFAAGLTKTTGATGILLFLSLAERRTVVLADKSIAAKLPPDTWEGVLALITDGVKQGHLARGLVKAIEQCGELVRPHFPIAADDRNELRDALIIKE